MSTFKSILVDIHLDNILKSLANAPKTCLTRLIEFGSSISSSPLLKENKEKLTNALKALLDVGNYEEIKRIFKETFLKTE